MIIGGGTAGLTVALNLSRHGYAVTVLEAGSELGGRVLSAPTDTMSILWGWQRATRTLLESIGRPLASPQYRHVALSLVRPNQQRRRLRQPWLPGALGLLSGLGGLMALSWKDRWRLLNHIERRWEHGELLPADLETRTASDWLMDMGQSEPAVQRVWSPLIRFLLGQDASRTSAAAFTGAVRRSFLSTWRGARLWMPEEHVRDWFLGGMRQELERLGVIIQYNAVVEHLRCDAHKVTSVHLTGGEKQSADWYVAAVPPRVLTGVLPERAVTRFSYFQQLGQLQLSPVLIAQFLVPSPAISPEVRIFSHGPFHWALLRSASPTCLQVAMVATDTSELFGLDDTAVAAQARTELFGAIGDLVGQRAQPGTCQLVRQPNGFLSMRPGTAALRPLQQSPFSNFLVAGDWTDTGLSPSVESAVVSGERCAEAIMAKG